MLALMLAFIVNSLSIYLCLFSFCQSILLNVRGRQLGFRDDDFDFVLLFLLSFLLLNRLALNFCLFSQPSQLLLVHFLESLKLLYLLHSFIKKVSFFNNFVPLILKSLVFFDHSFPLFFKFFVFVLQFFSLLLLLTQSTLDELPLPLEFLFLFDKFKIVLSFLFNLSFLFFEFLLFLNEFFPLSIELFSLLLCLNMC